MQNYYGAIVTIFLIGPLYFFTFLPSFSCGGISLDLHSHDQHIHDDQAHRLFNFSIPLWLVMWLGFIGFLLTRLTYTLYIGHWYHI